MWKNILHYKIHQPQRPEYSLWCININIKQSWVSYFRLHVFLSPISNFLNSIYLAPHILRSSKFVKNARDKNTEVLQEESKSWIPHFGVKSIIVRIVDIFTKKNVTASCKKDRLVLNQDLSVSFWLRQEIKESQSLSVPASVRPMKVCLELSIIIIWGHRSVSGWSQVSWSSP